MKERIKKHHYHKWKNSVQDWKINQQMTNLANSVTHQPSIQNTNACHWINSATITAKIDTSREYVDKKITTNGKDGMWPENCNWKVGVEYIQI